MSLGKIIAIGSVIAVVLFGLFGYSYINGLQMEGVAKEQALSGAYQNAQVELDGYTKKIKEAVGIANLKSEKLDQIISHAVAGRYADKDMKPGTSGALFSAIKEAYPDIDLNIYDRIIDQVFSGREAFKNTQKGLRDQIRNYENWLNSGILQSRIIAGMGYPSNNLEARIGTDTKYAREALSQMKVLITSASTNQAYQTGEEEAIDVGPKKN